MNSLTYARRALGKSPGFVGAVIGPLALAMAAACVVFSVADAVLFRPLPYREPDRLYHVWCGWRGRRAMSGPSAPDFFEWKRRNTVFDEMALTGDGDLGVRFSDYPERVGCAFTTPSLFSLLGVQP